jgi:hypothetical protein
VNRAIAPPMAILGLPVVDAPPPRHVPDLPS